MGSDDRRPLAAYCLLPLESVFKLSLSRKKFEHSANAGDVNHGFAGRRTAFIIASEPPGAGEPGESAFNGLITNDKFCLSRTGRLTLSWSRRLPHLRDQPSGETAYPSDETSHRGGTYETPVENSPHTETGPGRAAPVGSGLPASSAMDTVERAGTNPRLHSDAGGVS